MEFTFAWRRPAAMMALAALSAPAFAAEDDRPVTATLGGRLHLDFATFDNDNRGTPNKDDTEIRRAWVDVSGKFFVVDYQLEADFSGDRVEAKDVYLARSFGKAGKLTVGQFKQYFSL
ncbi:porin, partial [Salmonella sp. s58998]|uniref:porin n=1 Tax=Salmonella sp. s58998 TaxID=3159712 RepID=UPI0039818733